LRVIEKKSGVEIKEEKEKRIGKTKTIKKCNNISIRLQERFKTKYVFIIWSSLPSIIR
jgi:hypothetical protein